jgi:GNAT superfamily N-acetyltransferase
MSTIDPMSLSFNYTLQYRGIPNTEHDPEDYPLRWHVTVTADDPAVEDQDDAERHVAYAVAYLIPDAAAIDLLDTMDAVNSELTDAAGHIAINRADLLPQLTEDRPDLLYVSSVEVDEDLRGQKLGYTILNAIMETIGRSAEITVLRPAPIVTDTSPEEGTPAHEAAVAALRAYWEEFGFYDIGGGYMAMGGFESLLAGLDDQDHPHRV